LLFNSLTAVTTFITGKDVDDGVVLFVN